MDSIAEKPRERKITIDLEEYKELKEKYAKKEERLNQYFDEREAIAKEREAKLDEKYNAMMKGAYLERTKMWGLYGHDNTWTIHEKYTSLIKATPFWKLIKVKLFGGK